MSHLFEPTLSLAQFKLPPQDINLLSFCESNKLAKVQTWVDNLKVTQIKTTSIELYEALPEIAHLKVDTRTRFDMLEAMWPVTQQCLLGLLKEFLQQPLILPESAQKTALLAQALQKHLLDGYTVCAKELIQKKLKAPQQQLLLNVLYRALTALSLLMLRAFQLYTAIPQSLWLRAHVLFQVAEFYDLHNRPVPLTTNTPHTLTDTYLRLVMLASIRPNQLAQNDINIVFRALEGWARQVRLFPSATADQNNLFLVDLNQDRGPVAKNRYDGNPDSRVLELDFQSLVSQLNKISGGKNTSDWQGQTSAVIAPPEMPASLLEHVLNCWSNSVQRNQERRRLEMEADACIGLIDCHYHLCGNVEFDQFINPREETNNDSFLSGGFDALVASLSGKKDVDEPKTSRQTVFRVVLHNVSAGGYCVFWQGDLAGSRVEAGELIGIREPDRRVWSICVVRWIRQLKGGSQLGIQVLTNQPVPYGAASVFDMGGYSDYMRAIHIPAPAMVNQPPSLLTASVPFQENIRVKLKQEDNVIDVRLGKCVFSTSKFKLFSFETLTNEDSRF
jgi:cyclic-di-GMP-binding protein